jgi:hypothetical protein
MNSARFAGALHVFGSTAPALALISEFIPLALADWSFGPPIRIGLRDFRPVFDSRRFRSW